MRRILLSAAFWIVPLVSRAGDGCTHPGCTGGERCVAGCRATWQEKKTTEPEYSLRCEYACARAWDPWHAPSPDCRCTPPAGAPYVKKRLYKTVGRERVERTPKYEVCVTPAEGCGCAACTRKPLCWWDPFGVLDRLFGR